jgi:hypothetical protein
MKDAENIGIPGVAGRQQRLENLYIIILLPGKPFHYT